MRGLVRWLLRRVVWCGIAAVVALALMHEHVLASARGRIWPVDGAPARPVAIVLGASVRPDGSPSSMLDERLRATAELFRRGAVREVLVSGAREADGYDECTVMTRELERRGVPVGSIRVDPCGWRTFDSMQRARREFGVTSALVVSNPFHVARAVFLGRQLGIELDGVAADYHHHYRENTLLRHRAREVAARLLAWLDVFVLGTEARDRGVR